MKLLRTLATWLAIAAPLAVVAQALPPDWVQLAARGVDAAASPDNQRWYVGADGRAWRWNDAQRAWVAHGSRSDFARIDAAANGAAALTRTGELYVTSAEPSAQWQPTGVRATDVGIGGGRLWLADALLSDGTRGVLTAAFDPSGRAMEWRTVPGRVERIDVDPQGRAWALDRDGRLYVHDGQAWIEDQKAPAGSDVGVGTRGEVYVVAKQADAALGGGTLHLREPATGDWRQVPGRLVSVSVDREGHAFGTNSLAWVLSSTAAVAVGPGAARPGTVKPAVPAVGETTIGALAGSAQRLPEGIAAAVVKVISGNPVLPTSLVIGETKLNGIATIVARVPTRLPGVPLVLVGHPGLALGDYVTGLRGTSAADLRFQRPVFAFVPKTLPAAPISKADAAALGRAFGRDDLAGFAPAAGISLLATLDLSGSAESAAMGQAMGFDPAGLALTSKDLDTAMFADVAASDVPAVGAGARTAGELAAKYGTTFADGLEFRAPATALDRKRFGPAMLKEPVWSLAVGRPGSLKIGGAAVPGTETGVVAVLALDTTLALDLRVPEPDTLPQNVAAKPPSAPKTTAETLEAKGVRIVLDFMARSVNVEAKIARAGSSSLASLKGFKLEDANLSGSLKLPVSPGVPEAVDLKLTGKGELPSAARGATKVDMEVVLVLDEARTTLVPTATVTNNLTLADLVGNVAPGLSGIRLTRVQLSTTHVAGTMMLYGLPVRAVRYQSAGMAEPVVAIQHRELNLVSYIPKLRDTPLGSFGLVNTTLFIRSDAAKDTIRYADRASLPAPLAALLDPQAIADEHAFPLELRAGVNLVGMYGPREADAAALAPVLIASTGPLAQLGVPLPNVPDVRAPTSADVANARKVLAAFGIRERSYPVKANFRASSTRNASYEEQPAEGSRSDGTTQPGPDGRSRSQGSSSSSVSARDVACGVNAGLAGAKTGGIDPVTGLDLSFRIPDFKPPYAGDAVSFANTRFSLKEIDGQLEPAVVTSMAIRLPQDVAGIREIGLAAKIRVRGDLDVLCRGVRPDSDVEAQFAGSTALNLAGIANMAFASLAKVTELKPADPKLVCEAKPAPKPAADAKPDLGWKNAFGLPFLTIRKFASSGSFVQKDGKKSLVGTTWTESVVGSQVMDVLGSLTLEAEAGASEFKVADWLWRVPGPVKLAGLPGVAAAANTATFLELGDLDVCNLDATPSQMSGTLASARKDFTGNVVLLRRDNAFEVYAAVDRFAPNMVLKKEVRLPGLLGEVTLGRTLFALRSGETTSTKVADLPPIVGRLFTDTVGALVTDDTTIPLVKGLSIAGRLTPKEIPDRPGVAGVKGLFELLDVTDPVPVLGGVEVAGQGGVRGFADLLLSSFVVPGLPQGELRLSNTRISLSNLEGQAADATTTLRFTPPAFLGRALDGTLVMPGTMQYRRTASGDTSLLVSGHSGVRWNASFGLSDLSLENVGVELRAARTGNQRSKAVTVIADANFRGLAARARVGLTNDGSGRGGTLLELVARNEGEVLSLDPLVRALPLLPAAYSLVDVASYVSLSARGFLIAREAGSGRVTLAAEDVSGRVNGQEFKGQLAIAGVSGPQPVLFLANDERWTPARVFPAAIPKGPFANLQMPEGLVILSPSRADANVSELHPLIYDKVFAKLFGARESARVLVNEGLTVVGKLDLSRDVPAVLGRIAGWLPGNGDLVVGAGVEGASGVLAFYADVQGLKLSVPPPMNTFVRSAGGRVQLFFRTAGASGAGGEAGLSTAVRMGIPRLDRPGTMQEVDATLAISASSPAGGAPTFALSAEVPGTWQSPAGLEGFSLQDTRVAFGVSGAGTVVNVATNRAQFRESNGTLTRFALDLDTAWAGGAPTQLSVQFAKSPDTPELVVNPQLQIELANSVLQLALKSGSSLFDAVSKRLEGAAGFDSAARSALAQSADLIGKAGNGATGLMRNSPLSMVGVRNPEVFFATPGNDLPDRPGIERPPLGLGLLVRGQLILDIGSRSADLADGVYKINLRDGFYVSGSLTPPAPFSANRLSMIGTQPIFSPVPNALRLSGRLELPGAKLAGVVDASISGEFSFVKPVELNAGADVSARISIGNLASRAAYFTVADNSVRIYSAPDGGCTDVPLKLNGTVSVGSLTNPAALLGIASLDVPDPVKCATQVGQAIVDGGKKVVRFFNRIGSSPPRASYDCANLEDPAFGAEYPPGRIWIARDEYTRGASSGAYARYIFSEAEQKFRPFGARGALGATACGGLIGVEGVGLGRFASDAELWSKALTCNFIPEDMKGAPVNTAHECYAARGLSAPRPDLAGRLVVANGDTSNTTNFISADGRAHFVGGGSNWGVYNACGLSAARYPATYLPLDEIYKIPQGAAFRDAADCRTTMGPAWKEHPQAGQVMAYCDVWKNTHVITRDGLKRWIGNKDNWAAYNACHSPAVACVSSQAMADIPNGPPIGSGEECTQVILANGGGDAAWRGRYCAAYEGFDLSWYLAAYPDVAAHAEGAANAATGLTSAVPRGSYGRAILDGQRLGKGWFPIRARVARDHWYTYGKNEGRAPRSGFSFEHWRGAGCR